jgi:hypothetical protein
LTTSSSPPQALSASKAWHFHAVSYQNLAKIPAAKTPTADARNLHKPGSAFLPLSQSGLFVFASEHRNWLNW